jgi:nitrogen fixation NifU-like protein
MNTTRTLLRDSGYSEKAIEFYLENVNVGEIEEPSLHHACTGPCGDTIEIFLMIESNIITRAKFLAIGCPGVFSCGSAITIMIIGKSLQQALSIHVEDILEFLEKIPDKKEKCAFLAKMTLEEAIHQYLKQI